MLRLIELLDYFAEHPTEYLEFIDDRSEYVAVFREDLLEMVLQCHAALAPLTGATYFLYQSNSQPHLWIPAVADRPKIDEYLAEKKYLPPAPKIEIAK